METIQVKVEKSLKKEFKLIMDKKGTNCSSYLRMHIINIVNDEKEEK